MFCCIFWSIQIIDISNQSKTMILIQRITITEILEDGWFKKNYKPPVFDEKEDINLDDIKAVFKDSEVSYKFRQFFRFMLVLRIYFF